MTAKRTSGGRAASAEATEAEPGPDLDLAAEAPAEAAEDALAEDLSADAAETLAAEDEDVGEAAENGDAPALAAAEAGDAEGEDPSAAGDADAPAADDADAPAADVAGEPIRLHRRARHDETQELLDWLLAAPAGAPLTLDASEVDNISTPYVLAIVAAARARAEAGSPAVVTSPSPAFVDAFSDLGLFGDLMKMEIRA
ncbi:STAS domain-containing protein [Albimonas pacifica]|uniref:STAS domain-containing protein n=1 Tax=Albimonas pacifica TaxID=1114924 RepID=A0A1I3FKG8_9RHOB|nr:STAS domain-containing protein [Albimonas pacifica]SFI11709.1 STAS domain-containing protein [Albimonas pacifica]